MVDCYDRSHQMQSLAGRSGKTALSLDRPIKQGQSHPLCVDPLEWPPFGGSLDGSTGQIILPMTPTEIARELELLRPFLKEIMIRDYRYDRIRLGPAFKEPEPPDVTIDKVIDTVLEESRPGALPS